MWSVGGGVGRKVRKRRSWIRLPGRKGRSERSKLPERAEEAEVEQWEKSHGLRLSDMLSCGEVGDLVSTSG